MRITVLGSLDKEGGQISDHVVGQVAEALRRSGHRVSVLGVHGDLRKLISGLNRRQPDLVFNLMENFGDNHRRAVSVVGALELIGVPYTGAGPGELYVQEDKALTRNLLAFDGIRYPNFAVIAKDADLKAGSSLHLPLIVKPLRMVASAGVGTGSLVHVTRELMARVQEIREKVNDAVLIEEYVEGRAFCGGVLGNHEPIALPPIEMDTNGLLDGDMTDELRARLQTVARNAYRALRVRDYGRVDLRLTETSEIYVIEVNASCDLEKSSAFAIAAAAYGLDYVALVNRIAELAAERHRVGDRDALPQRHARHERTAVS